MSTSSTLYPQFKSMLHDFAWRYARKYSMPVEEFLGEAHVIFCNAVESHKSELGSFSTHLYNSLEALSHFADKEALNRKRYLSYDAPLQYSTDDDMTTFESFCGADDENLVSKDVLTYLEHVPEDARTLAIWELTKELEPPEASKAKKDPTMKPWSVHMRKAKKSGWTWKQTQAAYEELKDYLDLFRSGYDPINNLPA